MNDEHLILQIMNEARKYGLDTEVRATAIALMRENPNLDSGSAYHYAALEWDI
jgi:hypothetical protein